ncbi:hypothetical protein SORBI_3003G396400 [Sorghum bicolor]|uniref:Late embryogenesis abundant protein LEA-2 subgroup domain-containing protein n=1 Tax=Sorghum bicolor TaxID=4558 RepID=A0A1B6Q7S0_SORBI|nr:hypothetical protein SORBI_3003G396400 [Sorghum bicolor]
MSKQPVTPQAGGGEPSIGARGGDAAPPHPGPGRIRFVTEQSDGAGDTATARPQRPGPRYKPVSRWRQEAAADEQAQVYGHYPLGGGREEPPAPKPTRRWGSRAGLGGAATSQAASHPAAAGGALPPRSSSLPSSGTAASPTGDIPDSSEEPPAPLLPRRGGLKTNKTIERVSTLQNEAAPSSERAPPAPLVPRRGGLKPNKTIERVSTLEPMPGGIGNPAPPLQAHGGVPQHPQQQKPGPRQDQQPEGAANAGGDYVPPKQSPSGTKNRAMLLTDRRRKEKNARKPLAFCFTLCCILFWLLVVCIGLAILVVYLLYHPKAPRIHVSTATLNAGYIDELPPPHMGKALNSDLYVLAAIYNPNTKVDVVLRYMQLDLYFQGRLIGTQAVWPPLYQKPGDSALRSVHLVVSEVVMTQEDAEVWKNVTTSGGLVEMHLQGKFYVQLNFGRWLPFRYTVRPICALWLDPPPAGALRRARCANR